MSRATFVSVEQISPHVIRVIAEPYPTVEAARLAYEAIEAGLEPGTTVLYVSGPQERTIDERKNDDG